MVCLGTAELSCGLLCPKDMLASKLFASGKKATYCSIAGRSFASIAIRAAYWNVRVAALCRVFYLVGARDLEADSQNCTDEQAWKNAEITYRSNNQAFVSSVLRCCLHLDMPNFASHLMSQATMVVLQCTTHLTVSRASHTEYAVPCAANKVCHLSESELKASKHGKILQD